MAPGGTAVKKNGIAARILLSLLGVSMILYGIETMILGAVGVHATAVITSVRRQGGERNDALPGRYTYSIGYCFFLPDGTAVEGSATEIGGAAYLKADGTSTTGARYLEFAPFIHALERDTNLTFGQLILIAVGIFLIAAINRQSKCNKKCEGSK